MTGRAPITDFAAFSHAELQRMLAAGQVPSVRAAADAWRRVSRSLVEVADEVQAELLRFSPFWNGGAATQYKIMMAELVEGVDQAAEVVAAIRDHVYSAADALARAQDEMPAVVAVPGLGAVAEVLAGGPSAAATTLWEGLTDAKRVAVAEELRHHRGLSLAAGSAHAHAVAVMNELAVHYLDISDAMPELPTTGNAPPVPTSSVAATAVATALTTTGSPLLLASTVDPAADEPLFGDMYAAGALAASAAVLGRFRLGARWLERRRQAKDGEAGAPEGDGGSAAPASGGGVGGAGGVGSLAGAGAGAGGGPAADPPSANPALTGGVIGGAALAAGVIGAGAASGPTVGTPGGMGMIPPMVPPMGGAEGGGMGRRIPPWLVETEPVFGEAVPVTPTVIGAEPDEPRSRRPFV